MVYDTYNILSLYLMGFINQPTSLGSWVSLCFVILRTCNFIVNYSDLMGFTNQET